MGAPSPGRRLCRTLAAAAGGTLWLEEGACHRCALGPGSGEGRRLLGLLGEELSRAAGRPVLRWDAPPAEGSPGRGLDRRGFFRRLRGAAPTSRLHPGTVRRQALREALLALLGHGEVPPSLAALLRPLQGPRAAGDLCTLCGACSLWCPEGALVLEARGGEILLRLSGEACTGCGRCAGACPEKALARIPSGDEGGEEVLVRGEAALCVECGRVAQRPPRGACRCPACAMGARRRAVSPFSGYPLREEPESA